MRGDYSRGPKGSTTTIGGRSIRRTSSVGTSVVVPRLSFVERLDIPCPNRNRGCERSEVILHSEGDDFHTFRCLNCHVIFVRSKGPAVARGKLRAQEEAIRRAIEQRRFADGRKKYFT